MCENQRTTQALGQVGVHEVEILQEGGWGKRAAHTGRAKSRVDSQGGHHTVCNSNTEEGWLGAVASWSPRPEEGGIVPIIGVGDQECRLAVEGTLLHPNQHRG